MGCIWNVKEEDRLCRYCKLVHCESRNRKGARKLGTVTPTMRKMAVGDVVKLDAVSKNAAKTAANRLRRDGGMRFSLFVRGKLLHVERIS